MNVELLVLAIQIISATIIYLIIIYWVALEDEDKSIVKEPMQTKEAIVTPIIITE